MPVRDDRLSTRVKGLLVTVLVLAATFLGAAPASAASVVGPSTITIGAMDGMYGTGGGVAVELGTWTPSGVTFGYQWFRRCDLFTWRPIAGATAIPYVMRPADVGCYLRVAVTGSKPGYTSVTVTSSQGGPVVKGSVVNLVRPSIVGVVQVGEQLTALPGTWEPAGLTLKYQWYRDFLLPISGATSPTYTLTASDAGRAIVVGVEGSASGYMSATWVSAHVVTGMDPTPPVPIRQTRVRRPS